MKAVIVAGGKGTRLLELTRNEIPKPMVPLAGKPILQWQIEQLRQNGVREILIITGHLGEKIESYFRDGAAFGVSITYYREETPLGTAGALAHLPASFGAGVFVLVNGDTLFDVDLSRMRAFHETAGSLATLFVHPNDHPFDSDLVRMDGGRRVIAIDKKGPVRKGYYDNCVNAGLYMFSPAFVRERMARRLQDLVDMEKDLLIPAVEAGCAVFGYVSTEYVKDVGTVDRIRSAEQALCSGRVSMRNLRNPQKAVFLDRDGTLTVYRGLVSSADQLELEKGAAEAVGLINRSDYLAIMLTNQPVVARGMCTMEEVREIHRKLQTELGERGVYLDDILFCPHHPDKGYPEENREFKVECDCRKPGIGMLLECQKRYHIDLAASWFIGDMTVDIETGVRAGMRTVLVQTGLKGHDGKYTAMPTIAAEDVYEAVWRVIDC